MTTTGSRSCMFAIESRLRRARELQRHQEVRCRAHAAREAVRQLEHRRACPRRSRARCDRSPARTRPRPSSVPPKRTPPYSANWLAALEQQANDLEEVLVPAHGDAVLGDAAEARHHAIVERLEQLVDVADRRERHARAVVRRRRKVAAASGSILSPSMPTTVWPSFIR